MSALINAAIIFANQKRYSDASFFVCQKFRLPPLGAIDKENIMGKWYVTRTGSPFTVPGFHFGMLLNTRMASLSREGSTDFVILIFVIEPSHSTMKEQPTRP